jgi:FkbM family methyltransferase
MRARYVFKAYRARYLRQRGELRTVAATLRPDDLAVDIGAHKGTYTYWMRRAVGPAGRVVSFEPQPRLAAYLRSVTALMGWRNVDVRQYALTDVPGTAVLHVPGKSGMSLSASLDSATYVADAGFHYECAVDTLDRQMRGTGRVALVKVDVEGHELQVFRGAEGLLKRDAPALLFECEARHLRRHSMRDVFGYLEGLGYEGAFFAPVELRPLDEFDPAVHQREGGAGTGRVPYCNNFLFTPRR